MSNLIKAMRPLAWDFLPTIAFAILTMLHVDVRLSIALAVGAGIVQVLVIKAMGREIALLQWAGLGLALVFGGASMITQDPRFIMAKPTIIYLAICVVMLKRGWMLRYLPAIARDRAEPLMIAWGYAWAGLMALSAVANIVFAVRFPAQWPLFLAVFPVPSKLILFAVQYVSIRYVVRRKIIAEMAAGAPDPRLTAQAA